MTHLGLRERILEFAAIFHSSNVFDVATDKSKIILEDKTLTFRLENDSWNKETVFIHFAGRIYFLILKVGRIYSTKSKERYRSR